MLQEPGKPRGRPGDRVGGSGGASLALAAAIALSCLVASARPAAATPAADGSPTGVIETFDAALLAVMRDSATTTYTQRFDRLAPAIDRAYDLQFMGAKSLGRGFDGLDVKQRERWLSTFRSYMIANYAGRFHGYHGQTFETVEQEPAAQDTVLVRTRLLDPGGETVPLNYRLRKVDGGWRIVDVYLKGTVSELALRRSDFSATLEREGFDALVKSVDGKVADLASGRVS